MARITRRKPEPVRGVYLWGGVGRGKSMLMDLFCDCVDIADKRRVHFHDFMQEGHDRLRVERAEEAGARILRWAAAIAGQARLMVLHAMIVHIAAHSVTLTRLFPR